jgi:hypothetical protein
MTEHMSVVTDDRNLHMLGQVAPKHSGSCMDVPKVSRILVRVKSRPGDDRVSAMIDAPVQPPES